MFSAILLVYSESEVQCSSQVHLKYHLISHVNMQYCKPPVPLTDLKNPLSLFQFRNWEEELNH